MASLCLALPLGVTIDALLIASAVSLTSAYVIFTNQSES